jgi:hypothetical protein
MTQIILIQLNPFNLMNSFNDGRSMGCVAILQLQVKKFKFLNNYAFISVQDLVYHVSKLGVLNEPNLKKLVMPENGSQER